MERERLDQIVTVAGGALAVIGAALLLPMIRERVVDALHPKVKDFDLRNIDPKSVLGAVGAAAASAGPGEAGRQAAG